MSDYKIVPGRRAGDGWLVVVQVPGQALNVVRSFETYAEAKAEAERLASLEDAPDGGPLGNQESSQQGAPEQAGLHAQIAARHG